MASGLISAPSYAQQIWFAPPDHLPRFGQTLTDDFPLLFDSPQSWSRALPGVNVFGLNAFFAARAPEADLRRIASFLQAHRIALLVALNALPAQECGRGVEGMVRSPNEPAAVAHRLRRLGINVTFFAFDEPLTFGSLYGGHDACRFPVEEVARRLASSVTTVRNEYPAAKFADYEVPNQVPPQYWQPALRKWLEAYQANTGRPLDALIMDLHWRGPWQPVARDTINILHNHGVLAGIFVTASGGPGVTDSSWLAEAKENLMAIERANLRPDILEFATWMKHPRRMVPESDPTTFTSLLKWYNERFHR